MKRFIKENLYLLLIILISIILRFVFLDKASGLGYDELIGSFKEASQPNIIAVLTYTMKMDIHFPLYQMLLHCWAKVFSFADYSLRAFSAVCGVLTVLVSYFIGKELKSKHTGLICSLIFAINSFLIYYSQEVRMCGFMALLSSSFLLFLIKIKNDYKNKWNYLWFILFAIAVISSYTISIIFVLAQVAALAIYILKEHKEDRDAIIKKLFGSTLSIIALCLPLFIYIFINKAKYANFFGGFYFDASSLFVIAQNWFTPILEHGNPPHYMGQIFSNFKLQTLIFIFAPMAIALSAIAYAVRKDKFSLVLLSPVLFFLMSELIAMKFTHFKLIARYTMVILPNLLALMGLGFSLIDKKKLKAILLAIFVLINMSYLTFAKDSAFRQDRGGFMPLAQMLIDNGIENGDFVIVWNNREVLERYVDKKLNILALLGNVAYTSEVILGNQEKLNKLSLDGRKAVLRDYFASDYIPHNNIYLVDMIYNHMKQGQKLVITTNNYFDSFSRETFTELVKNDDEYKTISYNNLLTIKALIDLKQISNGKLRFVKKLDDKQSVVIIFEK